jgi:hypothetical protein
MFQSIAAAMTVVIRTNGNKGEAGRAKGVMWYTTTCVRVQWEWLAFPAGLIALLALFLVLVAVESRGVASDRLWKSSLLAMLFCDVDWVEVQGIEQTGKEALNSIAHSTSVCLNLGTQTLRLVSR